VIDGQPRKPRKSYCFGAGDVIGMGLCYPYIGVEDNGLGNEISVFYTKNGEYLGTAFENIPLSMEWYGCIGIDSNDKIEVNFGDKPFKFNIDLFDHHRYEEEVLSLNDPDAVSNVKNLLRESYSDYVEVLSHYRKSTNEDESNTAEQRQIQELVRRIVDSFESGELNEDEFIHQLRRVMGTGDAFQRLFTQSMFGQYAGEYESAGADESAGEYEGDEGESMDEYWEDERE
jgi:hypothetical protein